MKKLLLSSIIMLGVCGIATAQTDAKAKPAEKNAPSAALTPQKSTISASDVDAAAAPAQNDDGTVKVAAKTAPVSKAEAVAASVKTDDMITPAELAKLKEEKLAKANAPEAPKKIGKKQN